MTILSHPGRSGKKAAVFTIENDTDYITAGATAIRRERWNVALSYTRRETMPDGGSHIGDILVRLSAGYAFDSGVGINAGWSETEEDDVEGHTLGVPLTDGREFGQAGN